MTVKIELTVIRFLAVLTQPLGTFDHDDTQLAWNIGGHYERACMRLNAWALSGESTLSMQPYSSNSAASIGVSGAARLFANSALTRSCICGVGLKCNTASGDGLLARNSRMARYTALGRGESASSPCARTSGKRSRTVASRSASASGTSMVIWTIVLLLSAARA